MTQPPPTGPLRGDEATLFGAARFLACKHQPYLATALFAMVPCRAPRLGTFAVDRRWRVYIDPEQLVRWGPEQSAAVLLHEVGHLIRDHADRADQVGVSGDADGRLWNIAGDMAINDDLLSDGVSLPDGPVLPSTLGLDPGRLEEEYYDSLTRSASNMVDDGVDEAADCGAGADGQARSWEIDEDGAHLPGDGAGLSRGDGLAIRVQVAEAIRARSDVPGGWARWADEAGQPRRDWRRTLRAAIRRPLVWKAAHLEPTWTRPDRRTDSHPGLVLPGRHAPRSELAVIIDTSGSMSDAELAAALAEVGAVQRQCGIRDLWVVACDTAPARPQRVRRPGAVRLTGGGGTDLRPALDLLPRLRPRPDVAVVITDGWTPWPDHSLPSFALVVATTDRDCTTPGVRSVRIVV